MKDVSRVLFIKIWTAFSVISLICHCEVREVLLHYSLKMLCVYRIADDPLCVLIVLYHKTFNTSSSFCIRKSDLDSLAFIRNPASNWTLSTCHFQLFSVVCMQFVWIKIHHENHVFLLRVLISVFSSLIQGYGLGLDASVSRPSRVSPRLKFQTPRPRDWTSCFWPQSRASRSQSRLSLN